MIDTMVALHNIPAHTALPPPDCAHQTVPTSPPGSRTTRATHTESSSVSASVKPTQAFRPTPAPNRRRPLYLELRYVFPRPQTPTQHRTLPQPPPHTHTMAQCAPLVGLNQLGYVGFVDVAAVRVGPAAESEGGGELPEGVRGAVGAEPAERVEARDKPERRRRRSAVSHGGGVGTGKFWHALFRPGAGKGSEGDQRQGRRRQVRRRQRGGTWG